jgi:uncharacterized RDD family membrane protein YckC
MGAEFESGPGSGTGAGWRPRAQDGDRRQDASQERRPGTRVEAREAGFIIRAVAFLIDAVLLAIMAGAMFVVLTRGPLTWLVLPFELVVALAYFGYCWSHRGQTVGMILTRLRVMRPDGTLLTPGRATLRYFALLVALAAAGIGVLMVAFDRRKRGLHDRLTDTVVVHQGL